MEVILSEGDGWIGIPKLRVAQAYPMIVVVDRDTFPNEQGSWYQAITPPTKGSINKKIEP